MGAAADADRIQHAAKVGSHQEDLSVFTVDEWETFRLFCASPRAQALPILLLNCL